MADELSGFDSAAQCCPVDIHWPRSTLDQSFEAWREAWSAEALFKGSETEANRLCEVECGARRALYSAPCASPADFMVKAYVELMGEFGSTHCMHKRANIWDVDIKLADHPTHLDDAWRRSAYHDLDQSDLGACLLAFGRLDFSASDWIERAEACGLKAELILDDAGSASLKISLYDEACEDHIKRERDRLRRLVTFDGAQRQTAIIDELIRTSPEIDCTSAHSAAAIV